MMPRCVFSPQLYHPYLIDTSVIFNLKGYRRAKSGVKAMAEYFLGLVLLQ